MKQKQNVVRMPLSELATVIEPCLAEDRQVMLTITGNSMRPFLHHERDQVLLVRADAENLQPGDVPLYRRENGAFVLHRIVERDDGEKRYLFGDDRAYPSAYPGGGLRYTMLGDAQTTLEPNIRPEQIVAKAASFCRRGRWWDCDGKAYRRRALRWHRARFYREQLMWLDRLPGRVWRKGTRILKSVNNRFFSHRRKKR